MKKAHTSAKHAQPGLAADRAPALAIPAAPSGLPLVERGGAQTAEPVAVEQRVAPAEAADRASKFRSHAPTLSVVLPCLNEAANLRLMLPRLIAVLRDLVPLWEVIVVDDGSTDDSAAVCVEWSSTRGVCVLRLSRNFGKEAALSAGLDAAAGDVVVLMDADGQHEPEWIPELLRRWRAGADMVCTTRSDRDDEGPVKRLGTRLFYRLLRTGQRFHVDEDAGDFRLLDRRVVDALRALPERTRFMKGLYAWVGFQVDQVPYRPAARALGRSRFNLRRLFGLSVTGLTAFTTWPLRAVSVIGVSLALASFVYGAVLAIDFLLNGHQVSGWTTIVVGMLLLSGVQLMSLGVVGEYLSRVFDEVKARPVYVVKERIGRGLEADT